MEGRQAGRGQIALWAVPSSPGIDWDLSETGVAGKEIRIKLIQGPRILGGFLLQVGPGYQIKLHSHR